MKEIITPEVNTLIKRNDELKLILAKANKNVRVATIDRWLLTNDVKLTTAGNIRLIKQGLNIGERKVITTQI